MRRDRARETAAGGGGGERGGGERGGRDGKVSSPKNLNY